MLPIPALARLDFRAHLLPLGLLAATLLCAAPHATSQQLLLPPTNPNGPTNTPRQVAAGTARLVEAYDPASKLRLAISIKAPHMAAEEKLLKELQDKSSPNYKKYLTPEQWNARFAPSAQDEEAVVDWATSRGLTVLARYPNRLMVNVEGSVDAIQRAFNIHINRYEVNGAVEFSNDRDPQIPTNLSGIIQYVDGLNSVLRMRPASAALKGVRGPDYSPGPFRQNGAAVRTSPSKTSAGTIGKPPVKEKDGSLITNGYLDPSDIFSSNLYDYNALMAQGHCCNPLNNSGGSPVETTIGLATDGDFANSDVLSFASIYGLQFQGYRVYVGGTPSCCDDETTLDFEWSSATANSFASPAQSSTIYVYQAANGFGDFGSVFNQMVTDNVIRVVNISYGLNESYLNGFGLVSSWHSIFNQMLGQGMTIMAAAGDSGATAGCGNSIALDYPGSDPDVVSVGGTQVELYSDGSFASEVAWTGGTGAGSCSVNNGGTGGGCSALFSAPGYQSSPACGSGSRSVPDVALNAATGQNYYFNGSLQGVGGTSISSPMMSGFMAQENAYLLAIGLGHTPIGQADYQIYYAGEHSGNSYEAHYPFYDVTSGCNSNDITAEYNLGSYCAGTGYDLTTGWGSFNALQLAWAINTYDLGDFGAPQVTFSGPFSGGNGGTHWYHTDQTVSWTVNDTTQSNLSATGVAGFSQAWDSYFSDPTSEATPGAGNSFYSGPEFPNATSGYLQLSWAGQGCHYATVDAWDNSGISSGNQYYYYICYDTVAPVSTATLAGTLHGSVYDTAVKVSISSTDATSGVAATYYSVDGGSYASYGSPFTISALGPHSVSYYSQDVAGNYASVKTVTFTISSLTTTTLSSSLAPSIYGESVTFTAKVTASLSGVPSGLVQFLKDGSVIGTSSLSGGKATYSTGALSAKTHSMTAQYVGNTSDISSTSSALSEVVNKANTTAAVAASANPSKYDQPVTFTATITPAHGGSPTGTVTFEKNGTSIGTGTISGGKATFTTSSLLIGVHTITAVYGGDANYNGDTSSGLSEVTNAASTTTQLTSSNNPSNYGESVTFKAVVSPQYGGTPTGTVTFMHGSTVLGTKTLGSGQATLTISNLAIGTSHITVSYSGNSDYLASTSSALAQVVDKASTSTTLASSKNPSTHGTSVTFTAHVHAGSGPTPTGTVTFKNGSTTLGTGSVNSSGDATYSTTSLTSGTHSITAAYGGNTLDNSSTSPALSQKVN